MRCLECGAEMRLVQATRDDSMMVPGYEEQTFECDGCRQVERRRVFRSESASPPAAPAADAAVQAEAAQAAALSPRSSEFVPIQPAPAEAAPVEAAAIGPAAIESVPLQAEPPAAAAPEPADQLDAEHEMLRRAIAMVRNPIRGAQPLKGLTDGLKLPAAGAKPARKAGRTVQIRHDPSYDAAYAAKDTQSGLVVLRHQDSARLRAMCARLGWQVVEDGAPE